MPPTRMLSITSHTRSKLWATCRSLCRHWAYAATAGHDWRLDLLRGFAIFAMVVDHLGGASWLAVVTSGNSLFASAAGAFISAVGLIVGIVTGGIALKEGLNVVQTRFLRRALTLFKLNGALVRIFSSIVLFLHLPVTKDLRIGNFLTNFNNIGMIHLPIYPADIALMLTLLIVPALFGYWILAGSNRPICSNPVGIPYRWNMSANSEKILINRGNLLNILSGSAWDILRHMNYNPNAFLPEVQQ